MDGLTHSLIGLGAAKAGLEKLSPGATTLCIIAANAPDSDIAVLIFEGRWPFLQHHRGITHAIVGNIALALAIALLFYFGDLLLARFGKRSRSVKLGGLLLASLLVTFSHPLMDWTNNYGMRFLLPWNSQWFYGDLVFIVDPFLWLLLGGAAFLVTAKTKKQMTWWIVLGALVTAAILIAPERADASHPNLVRVLWVLALLLIVWLFNSEVSKRWGARIPQVALCVLVLYIGGLYVVHAVAGRQASAEANAIAAQRGETMGKLAAMPTFANPLRWLCVFETDKATYRFELHLVGANGDQKLVRYEKVNTSSSDTVVAVAARDERAEIFLGFARFPVVNVAGEDCLTQTLVQFADLRYTEPGKPRGSFSLEVPVECPTNVATTIE